MEKDKKDNSVKMQKTKKVLQASLLLVLFLLFGLFFAQSYAKYESNAKLSANIDKAIYLLSDEKMTFNIDPNAIIPSDTPYTYTFTVSNFKDNQDGDVNIKYYIQLKTTTNLPITVKLLRNQSYSASATNIAQGYTLEKDADGAWYKLYTKTPDYEFQYNSRRTDTYVLVVEYPSTYKSNLAYAGVPENIEVAIYSEQKV